MDTADNERVAVQKLTWRDLTVRPRRNETELRKSDVTLQYLVRPLVLTEREANISA